MIITSQLSPLLPPPCLPTPLLPPLSPLTSLITSVSSSFGLELALYALIQGHRVGATIRAPHRKARIGYKILTSNINDVDSNAIPKVVGHAQVLLEGRIHTLCNTAEYAVLGAVVEFRLGLRYRYVLIGNC